LSHKNVSQKCEPMKKTESRFTHFCKLARVREPAAALAAPPQWTQR